MGLKQCDGRDIDTLKPGSYDRQVVIIQLQFDFLQNIMKPMRAYVIQQHQLKLHFFQTFRLVYTETSYDTMVYDTHHRILPSQSGF